MNFATSRTPSPGAITSKSICRDFSLANALLERTEARRPLRSAQRIASLASCLGGLALAVMALTGQLP